MSLDSLICDFAVSLFDSIIPFLQIRTGLIQKLETTHLVPVAAPSCDVMMLLRPASGSAHFPGNKGGPLGLPVLNGAAPDSEDMTLEAISCVVSETLQWLPVWSIHMGTERM